MKRIIFTALICLAPVVVQAESIKSFVSDITLSSDGSFLVTETITYDFEGKERHGIFRTLPTSHPQQNESFFKERIVDIDIKSITIDDKPETFSLNENLGELSVKIGNPDQVISGEHVYTIEYVVQGGLFYYDSGEVDLYWNATGNDWEVPIDNALVRVYDPEGVALPEYECYFGPIGAKENCSAILGKGAFEFGPVSLKEGEGLTVAQAVEPTTVDRLILERLSLWLLWIITALVWLVVLSWFSYRHVVKYKTNQTVVAQYEPYQDLKPMYTGVLFDGRVDSRDITAGIVYLAEQGFFKIKHTGRKMFFFFETDDYEISILKPYSELQTDFQKTLFLLLFNEKATIGSSVLLSDLAKNTSKQKENYKLLNQLKEAAETDLISQGFFEYKWRKQALVGISLLATLIILLGLNALIGAVMLAPMMISIFTFLMSLIILTVSYRRRTRKGYEALNYLKGFKEFLSVTDKERFKFHNPPKKSPEQFMKYLPYAIAFGVEKEWAEVFKDISIPEPTWYDGQGSGFSAVYLSQSLGTFGTSVASASAATASSGGGSSGGGAGGGGGGSW